MKQPAKFEVENVSLITGQGYLVFARRLNDVEFWINESTCLNGAKIKHADIPRALDAHGKPRLDVWGFFLASDADHQRFAVGQVVDLESKADS